MSYFVLCFGHDIEENLAYTRCSSERCQTCLINSKIVPSLLQVNRSDYAGLLLNLV